MVKKEKLRLIDMSERKYKVPVPQFKHSSYDRIYPSSIKIAFISGQYQYYPRKYTFFQRTAFTSLELRGIADELDRLNKDVLSEVGE